MSTFETGKVGALTGAAVTPYYPPAPPRGTGPHRYSKYEPSFWVTAQC